MHVFQRAKPYDFKFHSDLTATVPEGESLTLQSQREDADINTIVRRFGLTGQLPENSVRSPQYGDFTEVVDFHSAQNAIRLATESFNALPPQVRERFHNDPQELLLFCEDSANLEEARRLGLAVKAPEKVAEPVSAPPPVVDKGGVSNAS